MFKRKLALPKKPTESFFLWGPRQTGKSFLLKNIYSDSEYIDLLKTDELLRYTNSPHLLREEHLKSKPNTLIIIDEVQKVPLLLEEVHWLIENKQLCFALCGSSARKLKRGQANLLGGRALRYELFGFVSSELGADFSLNKMLNCGYLPRHYLSSRVDKMLEAYVNDYLKEEIAAEGLVRNLPVFSNFLKAASFSDGEILNYTNIASDCGISATTVKEYFQILIDTLIASFLPAYTQRQKRKTIASPKFYFHDVGVVNYLAKRGKIEERSELYGKAFENWLFHELSAYKSYCNSYLEFSYWRTTSGFEVDFIINNMEVAIEAKATQKIGSHHLKGLRELSKDFPNTKKKIIVCLEKKFRTTDDNIDIMPAEQFAKALWRGEII